MLISVLVNPINLPLGLWVVPVDGIGELLRLLVCPVGCDEQELPRQLHQAEDEEGGREAAHLVPLHVGLVGDEDLDGGAAVEEVHQDVLVEPPEPVVGQPGLDEHPAEAGEGRGHLQEEGDHRNEVRFAVVGREPAPDETQRVVGDKERVEGAKDDVREVERATLEYEESHKELEADEGGDVGFVGNVVVKAVVEQREPAAKEQADAAKDCTHEIQAPKHLLFGSKVVIGRRVE